MTLPSTAATPANKTLHQDFADIFPSSLNFRPVRSCVPVTPLYLAMRLSEA
jgi:hypothetical protein